MPVPSDIRDAVRRELEVRALRLDTRAVFDHRTNMARARIMLMLEHGDEKLLAKKNRQRAKIHQQFHQQQTHRENEITPTISATGGATADHNHANNNNNQNLVPTTSNSNHNLLSDPNQRTTKLRNSASSFSSLSAKDYDDFINKTRFGVELSDRLAKVNSSVFYDNIAAGATTISSSGSSPAILTNNGKIQSGHQQQHQSSPSSLLKNQFVSRNAKESALATDSRVEKKLQQLQQQNQVRPSTTPTTTPGVSNPPLPPPSQQQQPFLSPSPIKNLTNAFNRVLFREETETEDERDRREQKEAEAERLRRQQEEEAALGAEEAAARAERDRTAARRREIMAEHPVGEEDLQLHSSSGWVQRAMERKSLEDDDDIFQYRMKLKERDDRQRSAQSPTDRYRRGFSLMNNNNNNSQQPGATAKGGKPALNPVAMRDRIPGSDTALQVGAGSLFKPVSLIPEMSGSNNATSMSHRDELLQQQRDEQELERRAQDNQELTAALSAVDDRRHRQQLIRFNALLGAREKLATQAGVELYRTAPALMSRDFDFMGDSSVPSNVNHVDDNHADDGAGVGASYSSSDSSSNTSGDEGSDEGRISKKDSHHNGITSPSQRHRQHIANSRRGSARDHHRNQFPQPKSKKSKLADTLDLLESATVSTCELIMSNNASSGAISDGAVESRHSSATNDQNRNTDATVIRNILKRSLVILVPSVRKSLDRARRATVNNTARRAADDYYQIPGAGEARRKQRELRKQREHLVLLRSWLKGCEVWIATELGLDSHAGFFSVSDRAHLKEFCSFYARMKQVNERNVEALMRKWQRERDIMTADPAALMSYDVVADADEQEPKYYSPSSNNNSSITTTLPAELSSFFKTIKVGNGNTTMMRQLFAQQTTATMKAGTPLLSGKTNTAMSSDAASIIGKEAKEATSKYFDTLEKFGIITTNGIHNNNNTSMTETGRNDAKSNNASKALSGTSLRLKQMLRKFAGITDDQVKQYSSDNNGKALPQNSNTNHNNMRRPSSGIKIHRRSSINTNNSTVEGDDGDDDDGDVANNVLTTTVANLFQPSLMRSVMMNEDLNSGNNNNNNNMVTPSAEVASRVAATEAHDSVSVLELFIALLGQPTQVYIREEIDDMMKYFHDTAPDRLGEMKLQVSGEEKLSAHLLSNHATSREKQQQLLRERSALQAVHAQLLHLQASDGNANSAERIAQLRKAIDKTDTWVHVGDEHSGITAKHLALVAQESQKQSANGNNAQPNFGGGGEEQTLEMRSVAEEQQRALALQKLAQLWKQLFVPFQYRMELLERYRNAALAKVQVAEQRYSECAASVVRRESLITAILDWGTRMAAEEAAANIKMQEQAQQQNRAIAGATWRSEKQGMPLKLGSTATAGGGKTSPSQQQAESMYYLDAEAKRAKQQKKQELLSQFSAATGACDVAIEKLNAIGEQLYYHSVLYSVKMKDDFVSVSKILRTGGGGANAKD